MLPHLFVQPPLLPCHRSTRGRRSLRTPVCKSEPVPVAKPKRAQLLPAPSEAAALLRKPEAVVAATAAGLFMLAVSALRSVRLAFASVAARSSVLGEARRRALWSEKRRQERLFLESAVNATEATLDNTQTYLAAQRERADAAEKMLEKIAVRRERLDEAARELRDRRKELMEKECELEEERRRKGVKGEALVEMEAELERGREGLNALEKMAERERGLLQEEEATQRERLKNAKKEIARLETLLLENERQLERERAERELYVKKHAEAERTLQVASGSLEVAVSDLEKRRKRIEEMEIEAKTAEVQAKRKQEGINAVLMSDVDVDSIRRSIETVKQQQDVCEEAMIFGKETYQSKLNEITEMRALIAERDAKLKQLHLKMGTDSTIEVTQGEGENGTDEMPGVADGMGQAVPAAANKHSFNGNRGNPHFDVFLPDQKTIDIEMHAKEVLFSSGATENDAEEKRTTEDIGMVASKINTGQLPLDSDRSRFASAETLENACSSPASETPIPDIKPKKRRGRPRKVEAPVTSGTDLLKPKRRRGRPKKVQTQEGVAAEAAPKRKRGRPRKTPPNAE